MKFLLNILGLGWVRVALIGAALAALTAGYFEWAHHERQIGRDEVQAKWDHEKAEQVIALAAANAESRRMEQRRQSLVMEATNAATKRESNLRRDAVAARTERDGLRDDLAAAREQLSSASIGSLRKRVAALTDVFEDCTRRYSELAEKAGRHASDALMFEQAWPK